MSKSIKATSRFANPFRRPATCQCASIVPTRTYLPKSLRNLTMSSARRDEVERYGNRGRELRIGPRWQSTPPRMTAPVRSKPPVPNNDFAVNEDPERLDRVYDRVLGKGGCEMLTEEVRWLAITHKSFDHGRRGFNDRLAFLGKRAQVRRYGHCLTNFGGKGKGSSNYKHRYLSYTTIPQPHFQRRKISTDGSRSDMQHWKV